MARSREAHQDVTSCIAGLWDTDKYTRYCALKSLAALEPSVVAVNAGAVTFALTDPSNAIVRLAARTLDSLFDNKDGPAVRMAAAKAVSDLLVHESWVVRETAVVTLGNRVLVGVHAPYICKLVGMLDDSSHSVSYNASVALRRQPGVSLSPYAYVVAQKLNDPREFVRKHAIHTLCRAEPKVLAVYAPCVSQRLYDEDDLVREAAVYAIGELKPVQTLVSYVNTIARLLDDNECVRVAVLRVLNKFEAVVLTPHIGAIGFKITDPSARVRVLATKLLGKQDPMKFAPYASAVSSILTGPYPREEIRAARRAMKQFSVNLIRLLDQTSISSRRKALDALYAAGFGGEAAVRKDSHLAGRIRRAEEDESHELQLSRLRRCYSVGDSNVGRWLVHAARRELEKSRQV